MHLGGPEPLRFVQVPKLLWRGSTTGGWLLAKGDGNQGYDHKLHKLADNRRLWMAKMVYPFDFMDVKISKVGISSS